MHRVWGVLATAAIVLAVAGAMTAVLTTPNVDKLTTNAANALARLFEGAFGQK